MARSRKTGKSHGKYIFLCFLFTFSFLLPGCGKETPSVSTPGTITTVTEFRREKAPEIEFTYTMRIAQMTLDFGGAINNLVNEYNLAHPDHAIKLESEPSYTKKEAARIKNITDMYEGNGPDMVILSHSELEDFYKSGVLMQIDELFPGIQSEIVPAVAELGTIDGDFVGLAPAIDRIYTNIVSKEYYNEKTWNYSGILSIMDTNPDFEQAFVVKNTNNPNRKKQEVLYEAYGLDFEDTGYVDYDNWKADFYNEEFVLLLEQIKKDSLVAEKLWYDPATYLASYQEIHNPIDLVKLFLRYGETSEFAGLPGRDSCANRFSVDVYLAVNKQSPNMEGIKEFMDSVLCDTPHYKIPILLDGVGERLQFSEKTLCWTANMRTKDLITGYYTIGDYDGELSTVRTWLEDFLRNLKPCTGDSTVSYIVSENIKAFIDKDGDANETARQIQEQVQAYLDENSTGE